jgi:transcriptional regulator with XRE-family HTH domain
MKPMSTADTPAVAQHRVRTALRKAREAKQLTQSHVANAMEWSLSKVIRIEKGEVNVSPGDLRVLLSFLDIDDPVEVKRLVDDARTARSGRTVADPRYREHLPPAVLKLMQFEQQAKTIRYYGSVVVPGLLQTTRYAEAVLHAYEDVLDESKMRVRIEARQRRRELVLYRPDPPDYLAILDESVLFREVGGPAVMGEQLQELRQVIKETSIRIRVVPFVAAAAIAILGPFTMLDLEDDSSILYRESHVMDEIVDTPKTLERHRSIFDQLWMLALNEEDSEKMIAYRASAMIERARAGGS